MAIELARSIRTRLRNPVVANAAQVEAPATTPSDEAAPGETRVALQSTHRTSSDRTRAETRLRVAADVTVAQRRLHLEQQMALVDVDGTPTAPLEPPELPEDHEPGMTRVEGDAFRTDEDGNVIPPTYSDVDQGNLGDCYLMAASAAVANTDPEHIQDRIVENEDGTFSVRIGDETEVVEPTFPDQVYADPTPNEQSDTLWPALIEKAYAQQNGNSYDAIEGGNSGAAMELLTGEPSAYTAVTPDSDPEAIFGVLETGLAEDHPMVVSTRDEGVEEPYTANHAYAVLDVYEQDGTQYVTIYNPWGTNDQSRSVDDMTYDVPMDEFVENFGGVYVNGA